MPIWEAVESTSAEERGALQKEGFVHVTGLTLYGPENDNHPMILGGTDMPLQRLGRWDRDNGAMVIVTKGGEVWMADIRADPPTSLLRQLCPNGQGVHVPTVEGRYFWGSELLARLVDPDWCPDRRSL